MSSLSSQSHTTLHFTIAHHTPPQSNAQSGESTASSEAIGIGAFLMPDTTTGGYLVKSLAADGAAARSGQIVVGDIVTHVDGCALRQLSLPQVRDLIRGPPEKCVELLLCSASHCNSCL
jgi:C-terminal processing protease CtpA/Prc